MKKKVIGLLVVLIATLSLGATSFYDPNDETAALKSITNTFERGSESNRTTAAMFRMYGSEEYQRTAAYFQGRADAYAVAAGYVRYVTQEIEDRNID